MINASTEASDTDVDVMEDDGGGSSEEEAELMSFA